MGMGTGRASDAASRDDDVAPRTARTATRQRTRRIVAPTMTTLREDGHRPSVRRHNGAGRSFQYRRAMAIALGAAIGVAGLAAWIVERPSTSPAAAIQSIAVLPLENLSASPADSYLADGITDELTPDLDKISSLRVISHGSALRFREGRTPTPEIARLLNVRA